MTRVAVSIARMAGAVGAALALALPFAALGQSLEYPVKAAYLTKFIPFITWPDAAFGGPGTPFLLCVGGADPFGPALDRTVATQKAGARPIQVKRMEVVQKGSGCDILFVNPSRRQSVDDALKAVQGEPVLTVTDQAAGRKGVIHFVIQDNRVRFEIDDRAAAHAGLAISSKLLSLAVAVRPRS